MMELRRTLGLLLCLCVGLPALAQEAAPPTLSAAQRKQQLASFDQVWQTIRDKHWDEKLVGDSWTKIRDELRPKLEKAATAGECRAIMQDMIGRLGQSHFGILPGDVYEAMEEGKGAKPEDGAGLRGGDGEPGFDVRVADGVPLVTRVDPNSPAAKLGVKPGWIVRKIRGRELAPDLKKIAEGNKEKNPEFALSYAIMGRLHGPVDSETEVLFEDGEGAQHKVHVRLMAPQGNPAVFGNLPAFHVRFDAKKLEGGVAYASLNAFFDPINVMPKLEKAVVENLDAPGFIIDLRGNPGGIGFMAIGMGGFFVQKDDLKLGVMLTRDANLKFVLNPRAKTYDGPLAILVDGCSASTSEILAGGLKDLKRARIFGTRTAGAALPSVITRLPNGDGFQYAFANYLSESGKPLEALGVTPDEVVKLDRKLLLAGKDPALEAALAWIKTQKK